MSRTERNSRRWLLAQLNMNRRLNSWSMGIKRADLRKFRGTTAELRKLVARANQGMYV